MDDIRFSIVKASSEEFQSIFYKAISWDKKHTFFTSKMPDYDSMFPIMDILETIVICYKDDKPIGYGEIFTEVNVDGIQLLLSYIIDPEYRKKGYSKLLLEDSFEYLKTDKPVITIPEFRLGEFSSIINAYEWEKSSIIDNYFSKEIEFNGEKKLIKK